MNGGKEEFAAALVTLIATILVAIFLGIPVVLHQLEVVIDFWS